ncbi:MAG: glycosyltransferase family 1 protein [Bacteroidota bacterium]
MNIVVNTRLLLKGRLEGIGWFSFETLKRITQNHPEHTFYFVFDRPFERDFVFSENVIPIVIGPQARHPFLFYLWFEYSIPRILKRVKADLFVSPDGYLSLRAKVPQIAVIHDLNFEHFPEDLPWIISKYYKYFFPRFTAKAKRIATVSEYSKKDIQERYGIPHSRIDVVFNGVNEKFHPIPETEKTSIRKKFTHGSEYFIFIGALLPRKNLKNLFLAFDIFKKQYHSSHKLVIVGARKWWTSELEATFNNLHHKNDIVFTGRLGEDELNSVLASASALTYVSYFEGFGIPILEAFRCGVPVITSNVTSMPEVAGNAALLTDPLDPASIAEAMNKIASDPSLCELLRQNAEIILKDYSWEKSAQLLWDCIEKTMEETV